MKTTVVNSTNTKAVNSNKEGKDKQPKVNGLSLGTGQEKVKEPVKKVQSIKVENAKTKTELLKSIPVQGETGDQLPKTALNLKSTLKLVEELHRRKIQRDKLLSTINTLEDFEVLQLNDAEETHINHFQGCELTIVDDNRRDFSTKNPYIIQKVAEYINSLCMDRLAEIEGEIFIPA